MLYQVDAAFAARALAARGRMMSILDDRGRMLRPNTDDPVPSPRLSLQKSAFGVHLQLRHDLPDDLAARLQAMAAVEPPLTTVGAPWPTLPAWLEALPPSEHDISPVFLVPPDLPIPPVTIVRSDSAEGEALMARMLRDGPPPGMAEVGFKSMAELRAPWRLAVIDGEVAAEAETVRWTPEAVEVGVTTVPAYRGRRLAGAVTAAWAAAPELAGHFRFYSTAGSNMASQRVAAKLGLVQLGEHLSIH